MPTSIPGNKRRSPIACPTGDHGQSGSILIDAVVSILIFASLGVTVLMLLSAGYRALSHADTELRLCLNQLQTSHQSLNQDQ